MALLIKRIIESYSLAVNDLGDKRTEDYFLVKSPIQIACLLLGYLLFITKIGKNYMQNREPMQLKTAIIIYNVAQVVICTYVSIHSAILFYQEAVTQRKLCHSIDYSDKTLHIAKLTHTYFLTKVMDLIDTIFFVLRKKTAQVTFLHSYHHMMMVAYTWYVVKFAPGGQVLFIGVVNSFVHVWMYFYYLLTIYNTEYKKSIWWKKHLTQLQLIQFCMITVWLTFPFFDMSCNYPRPQLMFILPQVLAVTVLFADYYYKNYIRTPPTKTKSN